MVLALALCLLVVALIVVIVGYMASGIGILIGVAYYGLPALFGRAKSRQARSDIEAGRPSATREEIMTRAIPGTYAWDLKIEAEKKAADKKALKKLHGRRVRGRK